VKKFAFSFLATATGVAMFVAPSEAATLSISINDGSFYGGGTLEGSFTFDTITQEYSNVDITTDVAIFDRINDEFTPFTFTDANSSYGLAFPAFGSFGPALDEGVRFEQDDTPENILSRSLSLLFSTSLEELVEVGDTSALIVRRNDPAFGSNETLTTDGTSETAAVAGGIIRVDELIANAEPTPEPENLLGIAVAGILGLLTKKRYQAAKDAE